MVVALDRRADRCPVLRTVETLTDTGYCGRLHSIKRQSPRGERGGMYLKRRRTPDVSTYTGGVTGAGGAASPRHPADARANDRIPVRAPRDLQSSG